MARTSGYVSVPPFFFRISFTSPFKVGVRASSNNPNLHASGWVQFGKTFEGILGNHTYTRANLQPGPQILVASNCAPTDALLGLLHQTQNWMHFVIQLHRPDICGTRVLLHWQPPSPYHHPPTQFRWGGPASRVEKKKTLRGSGF